VQVHPCFKMTINVSVMSPEPRGEGGTEGGREGRYGREEERKGG
jgi:hypothetical protein